MQATTGGATLNNIWHPQFSVAGTILGQNWKMSLMQKSGLHKQSLGCLQLQPCLTHADPTSDRQLCRLNLNILVKLTQFTATLGLRQIDLRIYGRFTPFRLFQKQNFPASWLLPLNLGSSLRKLWSQ